jgi:hypothetical protein
MIVAARDRTQERSTAPDEVAGGGKRKLRPRQNTVLSLGQRIPGIPQVLYSLVCDNCHQTATGPNLP